VALQLLVNQVLLADLEELFQGHAPVISYPAGILARGYRVVHRLVTQQLDHAVHVILLGIELVQRGSQLDTQFTCIESVALNHENVDPFALLAGVVAWHWGVKMTGTNRTPEMLLAFRYLGQFLALIQGAPSSSKGVSVSAATETLVPSTSPTPG